MPRIKRKIRRYNFLVPCLLFIILSALLFILKNTTPTFYSDVNEVYTLPAEIEALLVNPVKNPLKQTPPPAPIPLHFKVPILLYHYVEYVKDQGDKIRISLDIQPYIFEQQLKTLKDAGYTFMTPSEVPEVFNGKLSLPAKPVILSFDDGYRDFYYDVFPLLKKYDAKAVAYIVPGFLDRPNNLTTWQLKEISKSGLVEIGAHTMYHAYLKGLNEKNAKFEVEQSKVQLEKLLGIKVVSFAYPYGAFDLKAAQIVKNDGFETAVSTVSGNDVNTNNLYFLYRIRPGARIGMDLLRVL